MKKFDLEAAKRGERVMTRLGEDVRILCFDVKRKDKSILGLILQESYSCGIKEYEYYFSQDGRYYLDDEKSDYDLFMWSPKHERWVVFDNLTKVIFTNGGLGFESEVLAREFAESKAFENYDVELVAEWYED